MPPDEPSIPTGKEIAARLRLAVSDIEDARHAVSERRMSPDDFRELAQDGHGLATFVQFHSVLILALNQMARAIDPGPDDLLSLGANRFYPEPAEEHEVESCANDNREDIERISVSLEMIGLAIPYDEVGSWTKEEADEVVAWAEDYYAGGSLLTCPVFLRLIIPSSFPYRRS